MNTTDCYVIIRFFDSGKVLARTVKNTTCESSIKKEKYDQHFVLISSDGGKYRKLGEWIEDRLKLGNSLPLAFKLASGISKRWTNITDYL